MIVLLKNHLNYLKDDVFECFSRIPRIIIDFFLKKHFFHSI